MASDASHEVDEQGNVVGQSSPRPSNGSRFALALLALAATVCLFSYSYYAVFRRVQCYDDEGYMLIQIKHFLLGYPLYDDIVSFYGPMYFLVVKLGFVWLPFGHDGIRFLTIASLLATSALGGLCTLGLTRRPSMAILCGLILGLNLAGPFSSEPGHPQIVVSVLLAAIAAVLAWSGSRSPVSTSVILGSLVAAIGMTKVNIGAFAVLSTSLAILLSGRESDRLARVIGNGVILAMLLLPLVLIGPRLKSGDGLRQAVVYLLPVVAVVVTALTRRPFASGPKPWLKALSGFILAGVTVSVALCLYALSNGTTPYGLYFGIIKMPAQTMGVWGEGPPIRFEVREVLASLALALFYAIQSSRGRSVPSFLTAALKLLFAASVLGPPLGLKMYGLFNGWGLFLWILLVRFPSRPGETKRNSDGDDVDWRRVAVAFLAMLQPLQSYPVSGSQVIIGTMLMIPAAVTCLSDGLGWLVQRGMPSVIGRAAGPLAAGAIIALAAIWAQEERTSYNRSVPLNMPGSSRLRLPERQVAGIRWLVANIQHSCDTFLCPIGFNSLYLWAERDPTSRNIVPHEIDIFTDQQQQTLLDGIKAVPRPLIVDHANQFTSRNRKIGRPARQSILLDGIERDFVAYGGGTVEGYTLRAARGGPPPEIVECAYWGEEADGTIRSATVDLLPKPGRAVDRISIAEIGNYSVGGFVSLETQVAPDRVLADSTSDGTTIEVFDEEGKRPIWPLRLDVRRKLSLRFPPLGGLSDQRLTVVRFIDGEGQLITSIPFVTPFK